MSSVTARPISDSPHYLRVTTAAIRFLSIAMFMFIIGQIVFRLSQHSLPANDLSSYLVEKIFNLISLSIVFIITYLPRILDDTDIFLPPGIQFIIIIFIFAANFLGELLGFYFIFPWWDKMLHTISGVIIGLIGFALVYLMNTSNKLKLNLSPGFVALFTFTFALAAGAIWEIFEFSCDAILRTNMQRWAGPIPNPLWIGFPEQGSGLLDTMGDLIVDSVGALIISIAGYFYLKSFELKNKEKRELSWTDTMFQGLIDFINQAQKKQFKK